MKISNNKFTVALKWSGKVLLAVCLILASCLIYNFLLVPPLQTTNIGTFMADLNSQEENVDTLFLGTSKTYRGVDSVYLSEELGENVFNVGSNSGTYISMYYLLNEICKTNEISTVFLEVSFINFKRSSGTEDKDIYRLLSGQNKKDYKEAISLDYNDTKIFEFVNYLNNFSNGKFIDNLDFIFSSDKSIGAGISSKKSVYKGHGFGYADSEISDVENLSLPNGYLTNGRVWDEKDVDELALEYFYKILDYCQENEIEIVLYSPPYPHIIIEKYYDWFMAFDNSLYKFIEDYPNLKYLDFSKIRNDYMQLSANYFYNANHCNGLGAETLAPILRDIYLEIENNTFSAEKWFYTDFEEYMINNSQEV